MQAIDTTTACTSSRVSIDVIDVPPLIDLAMYVIDKLAPKTNYVNWTHR